jgi:fatty acid desaturase
MADGQPHADHHHHDHRAALAALPEGRVAALSRPADGPGLRRLAGHLALLAATGAAVLALPGWWALPALLAHGVALVFLFAAMHESTHRTAFATRRLNDAVAWGAGLLLLLPPRAFRYYHFAHHRHTQDPERDPELATPKPATLGAYLWRLTGLPTWRAQGAALLGAASGQPLPAHVPPRGEGPVRAEARLFLGLYAGVAGLSLAAGSVLALWLWAVPVLLGQPFLRAYLLAEHTACPLVPDMLVNTRTTFTHRAVRWLAWEMPWHTAHHAAPTVPFHRLAELTAEIEGSLGSTAAGYPDAHRQIVGQLR